jgi:hypothetical protein
MEFKKTYTKEEIGELAKWFETHEYEDEVVFGEGMRATNLRTNIQRMMTMAWEQHENPCFAGQIWNIFNIREALIKQGKVKQ